MIARIHGKYSVFLMYSFFNSVFFFKLHRKCLYLSVPLNLNMVLRIALKCTNFCKVILSNYVLLLDLFEYFFI